MMEPVFSPGPADTAHEIPERRERLTVVEHDHGRVAMREMVDALRRDQVVLVQGLSQAQADAIVREAASAFGLAAALQLQASLAGARGHRHRIGDYFMSVNARRDYQFITPHSEGNSFINMQLASFFCHENSTDGGSTILMNVDGDSAAWASLRERATRARPVSRRFTAREVVQARAMYNINLPADMLQADDQILGERPARIPDLVAVDVLTRPRRTRSTILEREVYAYWDSIESSDYDSVDQFVELLRVGRLLKEPQPPLDILHMDSAAPRRLWHSGVRYADLFTGKITRTLAPGELILQNNLTWTHAVANWTPGSGTRTIAASFA